MFKLASLPIYVNLSTLDRTFSGFLIKEFDRIYDAGWNVGAVKISYNEDGTGKKSNHILGINQLKFMHDYEVLRKQFGTDNVPLSELEDLIYQNINGERIPDTFDYVVNEKKIRISRNDPQAHMHIKGYMGKPVIVQIEEIPFFKYDKSNNTVYVDIDNMKIIGSRLMNSRSNKKAFYRT